MMNNRIPEVGKEERRTLSVLVDNKPGVLSQIARLFTRNGYNIESFAADTVLDPGVTRITIEVIANDNHTNRMIAQLNKMVPVHSVKLLTKDHTIRRQLALFKLKDGGRPVLAGTLVGGDGALDGGWKRCDLGKYLCAGTDLFR